MNNNYDFITYETFLKTISVNIYSTWTSIDTYSTSLFRICQLKKKKRKCDDKGRLILKGEGDGERQCSMAANIPWWWCITSETSGNTSQVFTHLGDTYMMTSLILSRDRLWHKQRNDRWTRAPKHRCRLNIALHSL